MIFWNPPPKLDIAASTQMKSFIIVQCSVSVLQDSYSLPSDTLFVKIDLMLAGAVQNTAQHFKKRG